MRPCTNLHSTGARVRVGQQLPGRFRTTSWVRRQGCILAPALFCIAIDWIMEHVCIGIVVGLNSFIDLAYADDTALFLPHDQDSTEIQSSFCSAAAPFSLRLMGQDKTTQSGLWPSSYCRIRQRQPRRARGHVQLPRSVAFSLFFDGYCWPDMKRPIGLAASAMSSLHRNWNDKCLSILTKIRSSRLWY